MTLTTEWQMLGQAYLGTDDYGGKLYIRLYSRYISQDETNLTSTVQYQARAYFDASWWIRDDTGNGSVSGTGASTQSFSNVGTLPSGETPLVTTQGIVNHDADTGEASVSGSATLNFSLWSWSATASGSANLPTIETATLHLGVSGVWKKAIPYIGVNGTWKKCKAYLGVSGNWKKGV